MTVIQRVFRATMTACIFFASVARGESIRQAPIPSEVDRAGFTSEVFFDDFDELHLADRHQGRQPMSWYNSLWYQPERPRDSFSVEDGVLRIMSGENGEDASLATISRDGETGSRFRFGYFEARMRWEDDPEIWAALWLFSYSHMKGSDNGNWCEIDIVESMRPKFFSGTVHDWQNFRSIHNANNSYFLGNNYTPNGWHTYGAMIQRDSITWFFDSKPIFSAHTPPPCREQELFLVLTSQIHGRSPGLRPDTSKIYPRRSVYFDWIRVLVQP